MENFRSLDPDPSINSHESASLIFRKSRFMALQLLISFVLDQEFSPVRVPYFISIISH